MCSIGVFGSLHTARNLFFININTFLFGCLPDFYFLCHQKEEHSQECPYKGKYLREAETLRFEGYFPS